MLSTPAFHTLVVTTREGVDTLRRLGVPHRKVTNRDGSSYDDLAFICLDGCQVIAAAPSVPHGIIDVSSPPVISEASLPAGVLFMTSGYTSFDGFGLPLIRTSVGIGLKDALSGVVLHPVFMGAEAKVYSETVSMVLAGFDD